MRIVLASASPRRKELLEQIGLRFEVQVSQVEEHSSAATPDKLVEELSMQKAKAVQPGNEDAVIIGSDTVVAVDGKILGKPKTAKQAQEMLGLLQGATHQVYTGVTLLYEEKECVFHEVTDVIFYPMTEEEIQEYVETGDPMDKAGAYGIQGFCARYIKEIRGDYNTVVGLPAARLYQELKALLSNEA